MSKADVCSIPIRSRRDVLAGLSAAAVALTATSVGAAEASDVQLIRLASEAIAAAKHWDVETEVFGSLSASYPSIDWRDLAKDMAERVATHGIRRSAEMQEAADMLADLGIDPSLSRAVAEAQLRGARPKTDTPH